ncbi:MAG: adenylate kinase [Cytophagales bacterium]|nr:adenylate kinase [Cytophagales bacterium]
MLNIVLFGPPGAGKGTQSEKMIEKFQLTHISTGDLFRKNIGEKTELGQLAQKYMDEGNLVPDEVVIGMVDERIKECLDAKGFIFDGFPRTVAQAKALDTLLEEKDLSISGMIALEVDEDELRTRILERGKSSGRTDDQSVEKINNRIRVYNEETLPVAQYYKSFDKYTAINGVGTIDGIFGDICTAVEKIS